MALPKTNTITPEDFFAHADQHPDQRFDFMDGEIVEVSPKPFHAFIQAELIYLIRAWLQNNRIGIVHTEVFHKLGEENFIPDIAVTKEKANKQPYFTQPPLLAVEIRSDTQSRASQRRKALRYLAHGTPAVLLVLPGEQIELYTQQSGEVPQIFEEEDTVTGIPGFAGLHIEVKALFE